MGLKLVSQKQASRVSFYGFDGHGSVTYLVGLDGDATDDYRFDAFGTDVHMHGTTANAFLYSGEQYERSFGAYYLRSRYMTPQVGRFLTSDTFNAPLLGPMGLHKYSYANNNPINFIDPTGLFGIGLATAGLLDPLVGVALRAEMIKFHKSTIIQGAILLAGVKLGLQPGIEVRNQGLDLIIEGASRGSQLLVDEGIERYQFGNKLIAASSQGIKAFKDSWSGIDEKISYLKFATNIKSLVYTRSTISVRTEIDRFVFMAQKVQVDFEDYVARVQFALYSQTRFFQEVGVLTETSTMLTVRAKDLSDVFFKRVLPDIVHLWNKH
jgi:RHS repeat-associated protein